MADSEYSAYYESFSRGGWSDPDEEKCLCHGSGWALSQLDTWHQCHFHYKGQRHPEDDEPGVVAAENLSPIALVEAAKEAQALNEDDVPF